MLFALWAISANICYTFGYALEFLFASESTETWWLKYGRGVALVVGTLFGMALAHLAGIDVGWMVFREN